MNETILIVDDDESNRFLLEGIFSDYNIVSVPDGKSMWKYLENDEPSIILLDVMMPEEDGFTIAEKLNKSSNLKNIPIIFVTAKDKGKDVKHGFETGAYDYIKKPFDQDEVIARVKSVLQKRNREEFILKESQNDPLTGLYNRRFINDILNGSLEKVKRKNSIFSLAMIDIDYFKNINDTFGHQAGDYILIEFSKLLKQNVRPYDFVARYGGEEFLIIFYETKAQGAYDILIRILNKLSSIDYLFKNDKINITFSCGITDTDYLNDIDKLSVEILIEKADKKLYLAKQTGRNRIIY